MELSLCTEALSCQKWKGTNMSCLKNSDTGALRFKYPDQKCVEQVSAYFYLYSEAFCNKRL